MSQHQKAQKLHHDKTSLEREFRVNDSVYVRNFGRGEKWIPGEIVKSTGPVSYKVKTNDGLLVSRHADQIKVTCADQEFESITPPSSDQLRPVVHSIPKSVVVENSEPKTVVPSIPKSVVFENSEPKTVVPSIPRSVVFENSEPKTVVPSIPKSVVFENSEPKTVVPSIPRSVVFENSEPKTVATGPRNTVISNDAQQSESETVSGKSLGSTSQPPLRRSERRVKAPDKLDL